MILAFETATDICSVAFQDDKGEVFEKRIQGRSVHSDHVFLFTEALKQEHDFKLSELDMVLVSNGPGSYTGLRIAASAVKGMLFGLEVDLYACGTLAALAAGAKTGKVHAVLDARRTHFYHQYFEKGDEGLNALSDAAVVEISDFEAILEQDEQIIGTGLVRLSEGIRTQYQTFGADFISARNLISLFHQDLTRHFTKTQPEQLDPVYLNNHQINNAKL